MRAGSRARRIIGAAVVTCAAVATTLGTGAVPAMAASGGGCSPWSYSLNGVSVEGCINVNGLTVNADGWERGSGNANCYIQMEFLNSNHEVINSSGLQSCYAGHHSDSSQILFGTYYSEMCVFSKSPVAYVCETSPAVNNP